MCPEQEQELATEQVQEPKQEEVTEQVIEPEQEEETRQPTKQDAAQETIPENAEQEQGPIFRPILNHRSRSQWRASHRFWRKTNVP